MHNTWKEFRDTAIGWWLFLTSYLVVALAIILVIEVTRGRAEWMLFFPLLLKWELLITFFAAATAFFVHVYKYHIQKYLRFGGFLRLFALYFISYSFAITAMALVAPFLPFVQVTSDVVESSVTFVLMIIVIWRSSPARNINDPEGPSFKIPVENFERGAVKPFGFFHSGVDIDAAWDAPVYAAGDGKVTMAWPYGAAGNMVKVNHGNNFSTVYTTLGEIAVKYGQKVKTGDLIGYVGSTGHSFKPHLHFETRYKNRVVDPASYVEGLVHKSQARAKAKARLKDTESDEKDEESKAKKADSAKMAKNEVAKTKKVDAAKTSKTGTAKAKKKKK